MINGKIQTPGSSPQVVASATNASLQSKVAPPNTLKTAPSLEDPAPSLMPEATELNAPVTRTFVDGLREQAADAMAESKKPRLRQDIPTADLITRGSFKVGTKLLIRIVPSTQGNISDYVPELTFDAFSLQSVTEPDGERYQVHETFEDEVVFLFGRRPRVWSLQGVVVNGPRALEAQGPESAEDEEKRLAQDMDYANRLLADWDDFYRGSKAVELRAKTYITYDDSVIEATLLELTMVRNNQMPSVVNATLTFIVHQRAFLGQEVREGLTAPNLADLIAKTQAGGPFTEPIFPEFLSPAAADANLIAQFRQQADTELTDAESQTQAAATERELTQGASAEAENRLLAAENELTAATQALARARDDLEKARDKTPVDQPAIDAAREAVSRAGKDVEAAEKKKNQAQATLGAVAGTKAANDAAVAEAQATEAEAAVKRDVLTAAGGPSGMTSTTITDAEVLANLQTFHDDYANIVIDSWSTDSTGAVIVDYHYETANGLFVQTNEVLP